MRSQFEIEMACINAKIRRDEINEELEKAGNGAEAKDLARAVTETEAEIKLLHWILELD